MKALWSHHVQIATRLCLQCTAPSTPTSIPIHTHPYHLSHSSTFRLSKNLPVLQNRLSVKPKIKCTLITLPLKNKLPMNKLSSSISCPQLLNFLTDQSKHAKPQKYILKGSSFCSILEESLLADPCSLTSQPLAIPVDPCSLTSQPLAIPVDPCFLTSLPNALHINSLDKVSRNSFLSVIGVSKMYCPKAEMKIGA